MASSIAQPLVVQAPINPRTTNYAAQGFVLGLPPQQDVGYVTDHTYVVIYLWNGSLADAVLTAISGDEDAEGISWDVDTPAAVPARGSQRVIIDVSTDGPLSFDGRLTFASSCGSIVLRLTGTRAPHLSGDIGYLFFPHNWEDGLSESLAWKTDVLVAHDRTEQRVQLRTHPRRSWDLRLLVAGAARRKLEAWLGLRKTRYMFTPVWRDEARTTAMVAADSATVYLDDPQLLDFAVGRPLALYDAWDHFEIRTVSGIGANFVSVDVPFASDWPAGSLCAPCRYGIALDQRRVSRFTEEVGIYQIRFEASDESLMPAIQSPELYRSVMVCPFTPQPTDDEETWDNKWVRLDNDTGVIVEYDIQAIEPVLSRSARFLVIGRSRIDLFLRFLFYCSGRLAPFWLPATDRGFELALPSASGSSTLTVEPLDYAAIHLGSPARTDIELITTGGTVIRRRITATQTLPSGEEVLTLDDVLPMDLSAAILNRCAWLELCRLDSDAVDLKWWGGDCLEATLPIMVLP
jgi:hypothetical protein